jgi:hypothetical protein
MCIFHSQCFATQQGRARVLCGPIHEAFLNGSSSLLLSFCITFSAIFVSATAVGHRPWHDPILCLSSHFFFQFHIISVSHHLNYSVQICDAPLALLAGGKWDEGLPGQPVCIFIISRGDRGRRQWHRQCEWRDNAGETAVALMGLI